MPIITDTAKYAQAVDLANALGYERVDERDEYDLYEALEIDGFTWDGRSWKPDDDGTLRNTLAQRDTWERGDGITGARTPLAWNDLPLFNQDAP